MKLSEFSFNETDTDGNVWELENIPLDNVNLIIGKNSTGKTRALNVLSALANLVSGDRKVVFSSRFETLFTNEGDTYSYTLAYEDSAVIEEKLIINGVEKLTRGIDGFGEIYAAQLDANIEFQLSNDELACVSRMDSVQHPFFEPLYTWGKNTRHYQFGSEFGKNRYSIFRDAIHESHKDIDKKDTSATISFLHNGVKEKGVEFSNSVMSDINSLGYEVSEIGLHTPRNIHFENAQSRDLIGLYIKEKGHSHFVEQSEISQGLYRVLSLLIQLNYSQVFSLDSFLLIDDIGEGLDFDRATKFIDLVIKKASESNIQLVMTTNDRFVMNHVPLEYWSIMVRDGSCCRVINYENSKKLFDEFSLSGLNNFDFFSSKYYEGE